MELYYIIVKYFYYNVNYVTLNYIYYLSLYNIAIFSFVFPII